MKENQYLNEEKYKKTEKSITLVAILVLIIGLCVGGYLIYRGVAKPGASKVEELKVELENKKRDLESKGVKYSVFTKYTDGEAYDLKIITEALDPSMSHCSFDEYKNNSLTKEYCAAKNSIDDFASTASISLGVFICISTCMIAFFIFTIAKRRHLLAFSVQQIMPVAKEGIKEMTPIAKERIKEMTPTVGNAAGEIAENIAKGIKKGLNDTDEK